MNNCLILIKTQTEHLQLVTDIIDGMFSIVISTSLYILNHALQSDLELENIETQVWLLLK